MNNSRHNGFSLDFEYQELTEGRDWMDCPEQRLIWAIIERCVRDVLGNQKADILAAMDWLWAEDSSISTPFSFLWCCEALEIDPNDFIKKVLSTREHLNKSPLFAKSIFDSQAA